MKKRTVVSKEGEIFRVTFDDGDVGYRNAGGSDIHVYETELAAVVTGWVARFRDMVKMLEEGGVA